MRGDQRLYTFHPRIVAVMSGGMGLSLIAVFGVIWFRLSEDSRDTFSWFQRLTLLAFFGAILWILYRMTTLRVSAYPDHLRVRNVFKSYTLPWDSVTALRFRPGDAWLQLFDADGNRLGILAVQAAEGARASRAAKELAAVARDQGAGPRRTP
ncbi:PH (Pleckstrin Homology) domain-containing protein [Kribbella steppae]|uniref:PH (Pleckstrin Homology) domain-containing protein n=1 Tax=Kribbella steppae TaxID=2512223 RepID=A0A4R2HSQ1_9ACTN|nr:PH domain-containing protein [Kribbella steppae]TCO33986.1 PH (Pleckstrin Homology) domain-containing protein [Kribbella steppae]